MLLIPAIDLKDGRCVRLRQGDLAGHAGLEDNLCIALVDALEEFVHEQALVDDGKNDQRAQHCAHGRAGQAHQRVQHPDRAKRHRGTHRRGECGAAAARVGPADEREVRAGPGAEKVDDSSDRALATLSHDLRSPARAQRWLPLVLLAFAAACDDDDPPAGRPRSR